MPTYGKVFRGLSATATGASITWVYLKSRQVKPWWHRGSLIIRTANTATAVLTSLTMKDRYAAKKHIALVASTISRKSIERIRLDKLCYGCNIYNIDNSLLVYDMDSKKNFEPVGSPSCLESMEAYKSILSGNYIRCQRAPNAGGRSAEVIITGTTDKAVFENFIQPRYRD